MQIMVEGLALAAFGFMHMLTTEPLLKQLLRYVMSDEARHVAFGVLSLKEFYDGADRGEIRSRQEFAFEAALLLQNRFFAQDVWEKLGADPRKVVKFMQEHADPGSEMFQQMLFSKIVPNCKKLGLLDAGDGWLRDRSSPTSASSSSRTGPTPPRSTPTSTRWPPTGRDPRRPRPQAWPGSVGSELGEHRVGRAGVEARPARPAAR